MNFAAEILVLLAIPVVQAEMNWDVYEKVSSYGQTLTLYCKLEEICKKTAGWVKWVSNKNFDTLIFSVKETSFDKDAKYDGRIGQMGFYLMIRNISSDDFEANYSCTYSLLTSPKKLLTTLMAFKESDAEQETKAPVVKINANNELNSVTNILIVLVVVLAVLLVLSLIMHKKECGKGFCGTSSSLVRTQTTDDNLAETERVPLTLINSRDTMGKNGFVLHENQNMRSTNHFDETSQKETYSKNLTGLFSRNESASCSQQTQTSPQEESMQNCDLDVYHTDESGHDNSETLQKQLNSISLNSSHGASLSHLEEVSMETQKNDDDCEKNDDDYYNGDGVGSSSINQVIDINAMMRVDKNLSSEQTKCKPCTEPSEIMEYYDYFEKALTAQDSERISSSMNEFFTKKPKCENDFRTIRVLKPVDESNGVGE